MNSLRGHFLVASKFLADPNFARAVVLLVQHDESGAFGVVLNRPAESTVEELWSQVGESSCESHRPVYVGGPVPGPLMAIHADQSQAETEVFPGVYFAAQRDHLERIVQQDNLPFRLFVQHSGWGGGQLENELKEGAWLIAPATAEFVFAEDHDLWEKVTQAVGADQLRQVLGVRTLPDNANLN